MVGLLILHVAAALVAPLLVRWWGRNACYVLALVPATAFGWALAHWKEVSEGGAISESYGWIRALDLDIDLRVTTLSWLMLLLVGGVGALVLTYCARYFKAGDPALGRFTSVFVGFAAAMLGLVLADNLLLLYVCWEGTTILSFLLIGHKPEQQGSRRAANQALIVTTVGGLAMLIGFIMLGEYAGTYRWSQIVEAGALPGGAYLATALVLILAGAISKSAIFPVSFWLPAAMAAPTPVSAYLHSAAMVKAGVYLIGLLAPVFAVITPWRPLLFTLGALTMLFGGWAALRQTDLKLVLAYGTVSQLGLLVVVAGAGTPETALAAAAMLLAHGLFKSTLFLVVGIVDHQAGTRELPELSGVGRRMPGVAVVATLAAASMAGVPPLFGFVAKEAVFQSLLEWPIVLAALVAGTMLTVAYSARFLWGAFASKPGVKPNDVKPSELSLFLPPAVLAAVGLALGPLSGWFEKLLKPYTELFGEASGEVHLGLWHGLTPALGLSALALLVGGLLFAGRRQITPLAWLLRFPVSGARAYEWVTHRVDRVAIEVTGATQRGSLPQYLGTILIALIAAPGMALLIGGPWPDDWVYWHNPLQLVVVGIMSVAALLAVRARRRLTAMLLVGVTGYSTAVTFVLYGAPDLALTQFLVETVTIAVFVLVLRRLPEKFSARPLLRSRWLRRAIGLVVGLVMGGMAFAAAGGRIAVPISVDFPQLAYDFGHGRNVVNVTLVDIRAWDTMGEISVLVVAATGVASLIFQRSRVGPQTRRRPTPWSGPARRKDQRVWLRGGPTLLHRRRSIVLEVVTRLLFHTMVIFSIFLLFSGHNAPGGGFAGGLVAGLALVVRYLAGGRYELEEAAPIGAGVVLGSGLAISVLSGALPMIFGADALQSYKIDLFLPGVGDFYLVTSLFFDIGVYLIVVGLVLDILRSLGAEVDRHIEAGDTSDEAMTTRRQS